ncbi:MAG: hypothetical protein ACT4P3_13165 [Betaproteobacteria bacterium]
MYGIHSRALRRAAEILGGTPALCDYLQVPAGELRRWLAGEVTPPAGIFFRVVDLIVEAGEVSAPAPSRPTSEDDRPGPA